MRFFFPRATRPRFSLLFRRVPGRLSRRESPQGWNPLWPSLVIAARQQPLEEAIEHDEQIAAAHLAELELGYAGFAVGPRNRHYREAVAADDSLKRQFDGQVEVRRQHRLEPGNHRAPVAFEGV